MKTVRNKKDLRERLGQKSFYYISELAELFGENEWTIRLWVNRFDILKPHFDKKGNVTFSPDDAERIGIISHLAKEKNMTLEKVSKHLNCAVS
jgi:DNA-binding transcriptional MerR regulator